MNLYINIIFILLYWFIINVKFYYFFNFFKIYWILSYVSLLILKSRSYINFILIFAIKHYYNIYIYITNIRKHHNNIIHTYMFTFFISYNFVYIYHTWIWYHIQILFKYQSTQNMIFFAFYDFRDYLLSFIIYLIFVFFQLI